MPLVKINMLKGKTAIEIITAKLVAALSIAPEDVFIIITEPPFENWGMAGKQKG